MRHKQCSLKYLAEPKISPTNSQGTEKTKSYRVLASISKRGTPFKEIPTSKAQHQTDQYQGAWRPLAQLFSWNLFPFWFGWHKKMNAKKESPCSAKVAGRVSCAWEC